MPRRILLADDSVTAQNMGRKILTDAGYEVITVNNGSAALKKIGEAKPDLIVLDVYMPGYSGLEVCFRIKEAHDTAGIPVLLTVGKLEPFKQDEARRARADAFIIKPFEASELLAALNKLEASVSATKSPSPGSPASPVKDMAAFERYATESGPRYGDQESGWKARLKFPSAGSKPGEAAEAEPAAFSPGSGSGDRETPSLSSFSGRPPMERPIPAGIPQDITPEEIAALSAAAARVGMGFNGKEFEPLKVSPAPAVSEPDESEAAPKPGAAAPGAEAEPAPSAALEAPAVQEPSAQIIAQGGEPTELSAAAPAAAVQADAELVQPAAQTEMQPALSSIAASAAAGEKTAPEPPAPAEKETISEPVTMAAAASDLGAATIAAGSRWVAEEIPVGAEEAGLVLEKEMHKAFAAFAAAEYTPQPYEPAPIDREDEPMFATMAPPALGSPVPEAVGRSSDSESKEVQPASMAASASAGTAYAAATEGSRVEELARPPVPLAPAPPLDDEKHAVAAFGEPHPFGISEAAPRPEARTAAAPDSKIPEPAATEQKAPVVPLEEKQAEIAATTAAAWANWGDIRDSVVGDKPQAGTVVEPAPLEPPTAGTGGPEDSTAARPPVVDETPVSEEAAAESDEAEAVTADSLSNIVDGMLAELKPKLMAELAKKLDKEKKDKKKKK